MKIAMIGAGNLGGAPAAMAPDLEGFGRINIALAYGPGKKGPFFYYFKR